MSSILFRRALGAIAAPARRTFTTTPIKRSSDPLIGHVNQEAMPGLVIIINQFKVLQKLISEKKFVVVFF